VSFVLLAVPESLLCLPEVEAAIGEGEAPPGGNISTGFMSTTSRSFAVEALYCLPGV
jgi:hypothetical protein